MAHDVAVIGAGPGGYAVAFRAAARGLDVALVEADRIGGTCLHRGCIPSKAVLHVAEVLEEVHRAGALGLDVTFNGIEGDALAAFRQGVIDQLHEGLEFLVTKRCTLHEGRGRILEPGVVEVVGPDGDASRIEARDIVLATGSVPRSLPGVDVDGSVVQTSDEALWFTAAPERAVIIGAGAIGMEFASMWQPMGTDVTVVEALDRVLPLEDRDVSTAVARSFAKKGIEVLTGAPVEDVAVEGDRGVVAVGGEDPRELEAQVVLVAIGRAPNTVDTGAAELGILDDRGFVQADELGRTRVDGVWAVGDVLPTLALAHAAFAEGFRVADAIVAARRRSSGGGADHVVPVDHTHTPRVTYCRPEVASVGLTEQQATEAHGDDAVVTHSYSLKANAKGIIADSNGFVKVVALREGPGTSPGATGEILGVHVVGPHATDIIGEATLATEWGALPEELAAVTHAHPTLYEALGEAFQAVAGLPFHGHSP